MAYAQPNLNEALVPSKVGQYPNYQKTSSTVLGTCHIVVVVTMIVINSAGVAMYDTLTWGVAGTMAWNLAWCVLYGTTAGFVLVAGRSPRRGVVITSMVLSIITAVFNGCMAFTCATMIPFYANADDYDDNYDYSYGYNEDQKRLILLFCSLNCIVSVALTVVSIWSSALGCKVTCCGQHASQPVIMLTAPGVDPVQATQLMPQGPYVLQVAPGQGAYQLNQHQGAAQVADEVLEPPNKV